MLVVIAIPSTLLVSAGPWGMQHRLSTLGVREAVEARRADEACVCRDAIDASEVVELRL